MRLRAAVVLVHYAAINRALPTTQASGYPADSTLRGHSGQSQAETRPRTTMVKTRLLAVRTTERETGIRISPNKEDLKVQFWLFRS